MIRLIQSGAIIPCQGLSAMKHRVLRHLCTTLSTKQEHSSCQYQFPRFTCTCHLKYTCKASWNDLKRCDVDKATICQHHASVNRNIVILCVGFVHTDFIRKNGPKCIYLAWFYIVIVSCKINRIPTEKGGGWRKRGGLWNRRSGV